MDKQQLLGEVEDLLRTMPPRATLRHETDENLAWFGRAAALVSAWSSVRAVEFNRYYQQALDRNAFVATPGLRMLLLMLQEMRGTLLLQTRGPLSMVVGAGMVFDYFDEVRKIIEPARLDLFFHIWTPTSCRDACRTLHRESQFGCCAESDSALCCPRRQRSHSKLGRGSKSAPRPNFMTDMYSSMGPPAINLALHSKMAVEPRRQHSRKSVTHSPPCR
jgi:hypothetical protein